jgi:hypothetical protein
VGSLRADAKFLQNLGPVPRAVGSAACDALGGERIGFLVCGEDRPQIVRSEVLGREAQREVPLPFECTADVEKRYGDDGAGLVVVDRMAVRASPRRALQGAARRR